MTTDSQEEIPANQVEVHISSYTTPKEVIEMLSREINVQNQVYFFI